MDYEERCSILKWSPSKNIVFFSDQVLYIKSHKCILSLSNLEQDFFQFASK